MLRSRARWAVVAACCVAAAALVSAADKDGKFSLAVLRRDGLMIPFAAFNGRAWSVPWPGSSNVPLPISLSDIPKTWWGDISPAAPWTAWLPGNEKRTLKLEKPVHVPIFCGAHLAVATDYRGAPPSERAPTVAKDAVATAGDVTLLPITQVSVLSADAGRIVEAITEKFDEEEELASSHFTAWRHPFSPAMRSERRIELETFYRASETGKSGPFRTSYIEAVRRYPALRGDQGCGLVTFARGWITEFDGGKTPDINIGVRITYCDRADVQFFQPFGRIVTAGSKNAYWVYQLSSWRDEFYNVASVSADGVKPLVVVAGGGCPKDPTR
jgi:hypothetical protein